MPVPLTSQEKKVLGFLLLMACLGLAVLAVKKERPAPPAVSAPVHSPQ